MDKFFENNVYVIDEKVQALKFSNEYKVYDEKSENIGVVKEIMGGSRILLSIIFSKKNMPLTLEVHNAEGKTVATLTRGWTFILSKIKIFDENMTQVGYIKQKFGLKAKLEIYDMQDSLISTVQGNWTAWEFNITDGKGAQIGSISKKSKGLLKEIFTDADKYVISIDPSVTNPSQRIAIASTASVIDLIYKERD